MKSGHAPGLLSAAAPLQLGFTAPGEHSTNLVSSPAQLNLLLKSIFGL